MHIRPLILVNCRSQRCIRVIDGQFQPFRQAIDAWPILTPTLIRTGPELPLSPSHALLLGPWPCCGASPRSEQQRQMPRSMDTETRTSLPRVCIPSVVRLKGAEMHQSLCTPDSKYGSAARAEPKQRLR